MEAHDLAGSALAGWIYQRWGSAPVFVFCALLVALWLWLALGMQAPRPVKTRLFHVGDSWNGEVAALSAKLREIDGVVEAVVLTEERVALLKVLQDGWDEGGAQKLIEETY